MGNKDPEMETALWHEISDYVKEKKNTCKNNKTIQDFITEQLYKVKQ